MYSLRHFHLPHHRLLKKDYLYISVFFRTFIFIAFFTFLPGLIYRDFLPLGERIALFSVLLFFFMFALANGLTIFILQYFYKAFGIRSGLVLSLFITLLAIFFLQIKYYIFAGFLYGILGIFWWGSYYILFLLLEDKGKLGSGVGRTEMMIFLASSLSPLMVGFLIKKGDYWFYLFSGAVIVLTLVLSFKIPRYKIKVKVDYKLLFKEILKYKSDFLGFVGAGAEGLIFGTFWPLFLYFFFKDFLKVGVFSTIVALFSTFLTYFLGNLIDKKSKLAGKFEKVGIIGFSASWFGKMLLESSIAYLLLDLLHKIMSPFFVVPLTTTAFKHAKEEGIVRYVFFRELGYRVGNLLTIGVMFLIVFFRLPYVLIFAFAGVVSFLSLGVAREKV